MGITVVSTMSSCMSGGSFSFWGKPTWAQGENANLTQKAPSGIQTRNLNVLMS